VIEIEMKSSFEDNQLGAGTVSTDGDRGFPDRLVRLYRAFADVLVRTSRPPPQRYATPVGWIIDRVDERHARQIRIRFGQRRWLVSWHRDKVKVGHWRARLSCPLILFTLERTGKTRTEAIERAAEALEQLLVLRQRLRRDWDDVAFRESPDDFSS
jgi:hypothetical protein